MDCVFCQIVQKQIPAKIVYEDDNLIVFPDINPSADIHLLIVPKEHIKGISEIGEKGKLLEQIYQVANQLVEDNNLADKLYRVVVNGGKAQHIPHLHFHFLGGNLHKMV